MAKLSRRQLRECEVGGTIIFDKRADSTVRPMLLPERGIAPLKDGTFWPRSSTMILRFAEFVETGLCRWSLGDLWFGLSDVTRT